MKLYRWQEECLRKWEQNDSRGIVNAVTGTGKTVLALAAAARLLRAHPELRIRIVAPTIALANQWRQAVIRTPEFKGMRPGFYGDGIRDEGAQIMIYVVNSARTGLQSHMRADIALGRHVMLICDECHRYKSKENYKMFGFIDREIARMPLYHCIGLSATPFSGDGDEKLTAVLGREVFCYDLAQAGMQQTISPFCICQVAADFLDDEAAEYRKLSDEIRKALAILYSSYPYLKDLTESSFMREVSRLARAADMDPEDPAAQFLLLTYSRKRISVLAEARVRCCLDIIARNRGRGRILVFAERIEQAERIHRLLLRRYGSIAGLYHSGMSRDARRRVLNDFREERTSILVSCKCLDEGLDVPDASIGIVVSSSAVPRQRIQRLGRIIRRSDGKDFACLYYIYVRDTSEDCAYLAGVDADRTFDLRYYSSEAAFSNDMYEYVAGRFFRELPAADSRAGDAASAAIEKQRLEIRRCIIEGLCLPDYLLDDDVLSRHLRLAGSTHEKNYYLVMRRIHAEYTSSG